MSPRSSNIATAPEKIMCELHSVDAKELATYINTHLWKRAKAGEHLNGIVGYLASEFSNNFGSFIYPSKELNLIHQNKYYKRVIKDIRAKIGNSIYNGKIKQVIQKHLANPKNLGLISDVPVTQYEYVYPQPNIYKPMPKPPQYNNYPQAPPPYGFRANLYNHQPSQQYNNYRIPPPYPYSSQNIPVPQYDYGFNNNANAPQVRKIYSSSEAQENLRNEVTDTIYAEIKDVLEKNPEIEMDLSSKFQLGMSIPIGAVGIGFAVFIVCFILIVFSVIIAEDNKFHRHRYV